MKTFTVDSGTLKVEEQGAALQKLDGSGPLLDDKNAQVYGKRVREIQASQIAAHRRDPLFERDLQAAAGQAGNLTAEELAALPAPE